MKIISEMDKKFFGLKNKLRSISLIAYMFLQKCLCLLFIVFALLYPAGCQHNFHMVVLPSAV